MNQPDTNGSTNEPIAYSIDDLVRRRILPLSRSSIYQEIQAGNLRSLRIGKRRIITAVDLRAWLESRSSVLPSEAPMIALRRPEDLSVPLKRARNGGRKRRTSPPAR